MSESCSGQYPVIVSACLAGEACRYDGRSSPPGPVLELVRAGLCLAVCPEVLGGLPVPRIPCEIRGTHVVTAGGDDCTQAFRLGAQRALSAALACGARCAVLKSRSPSCGAGSIYDGTFSRTLVPGNGLFADALLQAGISVFTEETYPGLDELRRAGLAD